MNKALISVSSQCRALNVCLSAIFTSSFYRFTQTLHLLSSYSPYMCLTIQQPPVFHNLSLQFHLDVEQLLILPCFELDVVADLRELLLQPHDDHVVPLHLHVITRLYVMQGGLQGRNLPRVKTLISKLNSWV